MTILIIYKKTMVQEHNIITYSYQFHYIPEIGNSNFNHDSLHDELNFIYSSQFIYLKLAVYLSWWQHSAIPESKVRQSKLYEFCNKEYKLFISLNIDKAARETERMYCF